MNSGFSTSAAVMEVLGESAGNDVLRLLGEALKVTTSSSPLLRRCLSGREASGCSRASCDTDRWTGGSADADMSAGNGSCDDVMRRGASGVTPSGSGARMDSLLRSAGRCEVRRLLVGDVCRSSLRDIWRLMLATDDGPACVDAMLRSARHRSLPRRELRRSGVTCTHDGR